MKRALRTALVIFVVTAFVGPAAGQVDKLLKDLGIGGQTSPGTQTSPAASGLSDERIASGLKEALNVGTRNAVNLTGKVDGYFANQAIKILMPEKLKTLESGLRAVGYGPQVDEFVLSMNRAAEKAAPSARTIFGDAITAMTFDDARRILGGGETAATEYFKGKTTDQLTTAFRPVVEKSMNEVGVTRSYQQLLGLAKAVPFLNLEGFDLDSYVVGKGLDGLFVVLADEERKIRKNPTARVTELLKDVFGR
ncbi:MAG TPA: DUF4197 domain-containing protein [Methylomirabilota bacterium]